LTARCPPAMSMFVTSGVPVTMWVRIGNLGLRQKLLGAFGVILVITIILSAFSYRAVLEDERASDRVIHTENVIGDLNELLNTLYSVRVSYSAFLLTGQDSSLVPFEAGRERYAALFDHLKQETADNPDQQARLDSLDARVNAWFTGTMDPVLAERGTSPSANPATDADILNAIQASREEFS
jgi:methyl-accepting chemotaxis protein